MIRLIPEIISTPGKKREIKTSQQDLKPGSLIFLSGDERLIRIHSLILFCAFGTTFRCCLLYRMMKYFSVASMAILKWDVLLSLGFSEDWVHFQWAEGDGTPSTFLLGR